MNEHSRRLTIMRENGMEYAAESELIVHGLHAREFNYYLQLVTAQQLSYLSDFEQIHKRKIQILAGIRQREDELTSSESKIVGDSRDVEVKNMENLRKIIGSICDYVDFCRNAGMPPTG